MLSQSPVLHALPGEQSALTLLATQMLCCDPVVRAAELVWLPHQAHAAAPPCCFRATLLPSHCKLATRPSGSACALQVPCDGVWWATPPHGYGWMQ